MQTRKNKKLNIIEVYNSNFPTLFPHRDRVVNEIKSLTYNNSEMKVADNLWKQCK